ncbi:uncharacterized protein LOC106175050 [Lingula anatina]|uniref:Uncharacterized protein LOC106175050 n=1 Tax=Lingula anatina TaxID=7574 RepID=A0A1S3JPM8_LINAN|nr:uncharacterized protein LOC106175050 [Lingula anatina]|eukprot:XP_013412318.1 uncharacterized protein LOC106175050 [Lingula anatina]
MSPCNGCLPVFQYCEPGILRCVDCSLPCGAKDNQLLQFDCMQHCKAYNALRLSTRAPETGPSKYSARPPDLDLPASTTPILLRNTDRPLPVIRGVTFAVVGAVALAVVFALVSVVIAVLLCRLRKRYRKRRMQRETEACELAVFVPEPAVEPAMGPLCIVDKSFDVGIPLGTTEEGPSQPSSYGGATSRNQDDMATTALLICRDLNAHGDCGKCVVPPEEDTRLKSFG